jgi:type IV secretory pathway VirJ component
MSLKTGRTAVLLISFTFFLISRSLAIPGSDSLKVALFGKVYIYNQSAVPENLVIIISGDAGWKSGVISYAETFSGMNSIVVGVDILSYYKNLRQRATECLTVAPDFVQLATEIEKLYKFPEYKPAIIMGCSSGATLVYGILAQALPGTFAGGISLGFCPEIYIPGMLCQTNGLSEKTKVAGKSYLLMPDSKLGNHWIVLQGQHDDICNYSEVADFVSKTSDADLITLPEVGHGFSKSNDFMPQWKEAFRTLINKSEEAQPTDVKNENVKNIPVVVTKAKADIKEAPVALLISGDGGWYSFEQNIANHLAGQGIPTLGLDARKYFWARKTPEETSEDIANVIRNYMKEWGKERFVLIGYSLGAEIVPFIVSRLPEDMKSKIISEILLSPATNTDFEIHISNMIGIGNHQNTYTVVDEIKKNKQIPTLIIFGDGENTKVPELLNGTSVKIIKIPGDHHYKFNVPLIMQVIKDNKAL